MEIIEYDAKYRDDFIQFNKDWIIDNFGVLEKEDIETFDTIDEELAKGGMIYFAVEGGVVLAACMTKPMENGTWEICKLCSNKNRQHKGCGSAVFGAAVQWAVGHDAKRLFILSNSRLRAAIHIYEKHGFKEIKLDDYEYDRGDIAFERVIDQ